MTKQQFEQIKRDYPIREITPDQHKEMGLCLFEVQANDECRGKCTCGANSCCAWHCTSCGSMT